MAQTPRALRLRSEIHKPDRKSNMQRNKTLNCLDALIVDAGGADHGTQSEGSCGLLLEHLQAARRDLLGSMPGGYSLSLQQAEESLACISNKSARAEMKKVLRTLIGSQSDA
jgi:hypothetical protein